MTNTFHSTMKHVKNNGDGVVFVLPLRIKEKASIREFKTYKEKRVFPLISAENEKLSIVRVYYFKEQNFRFNCIFNFCNWIYFCCTI